VACFGGWKQPQPRNMASQELLAAFAKAGTEQEGLCLAWQGSSCQSSNSQQCAPIKTREKRTLNFFSTSAICDRACVNPGETVNVSDHFKR